MDQLKEGGRGGTGHYTGGFYLIMFTEASASTNPINSLKNTGARLIL